MSKINENLKTLYSEILSKVKTKCICKKLKRIKNSKSSRNNFERDPIFEIPTICVKLLVNHLEFIRSFSLVEFQMRYINYLYRCLQIISFIWLSEILTYSFWTFLLHIVTYFTLYTKEASYTVQYGCMWNFRYSYVLNLPLKSLWLNNA